VIFQPVLDIVVVVQLLTLL